MGKSFNDDVFNNNILDSINGLTISKEAIEENTKPKKAKYYCNKTFCLWHISKKWIC